MDAIDHLRDELRRAVGNNDVVAKRQGGGGGGDASRQKEIRVVRRHRLCCDMNQRNCDLSVAAGSKPDSGDLA